MKRILVLAAVLAFPAAAVAQLYKWVDKDGKVTYSDQPPPAQQTKQLNVPTGAGSPPARTARDKDKELDKGRTEAAEKTKAAEEAQAKAKAEAENCNRAKAYLRTMTDGGRITTTDANGERVFLDDKQIELERAKAQQMVDDVCKTP